MGSFKSDSSFQGLTLDKRLDFSSLHLLICKRRAMLALGPYDGLGSLARMKQVIQSLFTLQLSLPPAPCQQFS